MTDRWRTSGWDNFLVRKGTAQTKDNNDSNRGGWGSLHVWTKGYEQACCVCVPPPPPPAPPHPPRNLTQPPSPHTHTHRLNCSSVVNAGSWSCPPFRLPPHQCRLLRRAIGMCSCVSSIIWWLHLSVRLRCGCPPSLRFGLWPTHLVETHSRIISERTIQEYPCCCL